MYEWIMSNSTVEPLLLDITSSQVYNYIRKDVVKSTTDVDGETVVSYTYLEKKIPKSEWNYYMSLAKLEESTTNNIVDLENAICELTKLL